MNNCGFIIYLSGCNTYDQSFEVIVFFLLCLWPITMCPCVVSVLHQFSLEKYYFWALGFQCLILNLAQEYSRIFSSLVSQSVDLSTLYIIFVYLELLQKIVVKFILHVNSKNRCLVKVLFSLQLKKIITLSAWSVITSCCLEVILTMAL